jgi:hypothetical protein
MLSIVWHEYIEPVTLEQLKDELETSEMGKSPGYDVNTELTKYAGLAGRFLK